MRSGRLPSNSPWTATLVLVAGLTVLRLLAVFATPLELYPDEAQYWLWSRELAWGYYSKPPMVAWIIAATTAVGGDSEPWVRLGAVLAHAGAPLALHRAGARLYDGWSGFWAAVVYSLMPGVQLSAGVMTTDAPMLLFLSLALWAYAALLKPRSGRTSLFAAAGLGAALGLAVLSKYAALYLVAGILLHGAFDRAARARWRPASMAAAAGAALLVWAPNLFWNATHGFATVAHTADNAQWSGDQLFNPEELMEFAGGQLGVFGPLPFLVLLAGGLAILIRARLRRGLRSEDLGLLCLTLPPLAIVAAQAFISRANANWAVAAYAPASVLVAAWLVRSQASQWARWTLRGAVASQALLAAVFLIAVISPAAASTLGLNDAFKRARGWEAATRVVTDWAGRRPWTAVTTDDRFLFNAMAYYGREFWARPDTPPLRMWVRETQPQNQAETEAPLRLSEAGLVLHASLVPAYALEAARDFRTWRRLGVAQTHDDQGRLARETALFEASGWARAPRDPATGRPYELPRAP